MRLGGMFMDRLHLTEIIKCDKTLHINKKEKEMIWFCLFSFLCLWNRMNQCSLDIVFDLKTSKRIVNLWLIRLCLLTKWWTTKCRRICKWIGCCRCRWLHISHCTKTSLLELTKKNHIINWTNQWNKSPSIQIIIYLKRVCLLNQSRKEKHIRQEKLSVFFKKN